MRGRRLGRRLAIALLALAGVIVFGVVGNMLLGRSLLDAVYQTTVTVGQVGSGAAPTSVAGELFTIVLIFAGVTSIAFALASLIDFLVEGNLRGVVERRRMNRQLSELQGHTVIAGLGRVGSVVARLLAADEAPFVVLDTCEECIETAQENGWLYVQGDATDEESLIEAGIERAGSLVSTLDSDAENLFVTVTARALNPKLLIVARSATESSEQKLLKGGADRVITPNVIGGRRMAAMVLHPVVADYLDLVSHGDGVEFRLQEVEVPQDSQFAERSIAESAIRETTGAYILAIRRDDGTVNTNPHPDTVLHVGERLVVLGTPEHVARFVAECTTCKL